MSIHHHSQSSRSPVASLIAALAALALAPMAIAGAQGPAVDQPPGSHELGIDAALVFGLGDQSSVRLELPAARARIAFTSSANSRWAWEPAIGLSYVKVEDADGVLFYNVEGGALYHFRPAGDLAALGATVSYVRPFVGIVGFTGDDGDNEVSLGAGFGIKRPWLEDLAFRLEANAGYGLDNEAFRLGAFAGLSFFTRNLFR